MTESCVVCKAELTKVDVRADKNFYECPKCGPYSLTASTRAVIEGEIEKTVNGRAKLSHALNGLSKSKMWITIDLQQAKDLLAHTELPKPIELVDNFILWMGSTQSSLGAACEISDGIDSIIGATEEDDVPFLVEHCKQAGMLSGSVERYGNGGFAVTPLQLTVAGWGRYEELKRGTSAIRSAFMAMQFGDAELDGLYNTHLKKAVAETGFELRRVDENQPAGMIDDHLRVKIRQCRFLIADLTHQNRGAYWEAGFAEGLGKPVIYMCRRDEFENKSLGTHFDTNHHLTVVWEPNDLASCVRRLKDTIRATLPAEAVLEDSK